MKIVKRENWGRAWEDKFWNFEQKGRRERERDCRDEEEKGCETLTEFLGGDDDDDASVGCFRNKG